VAVVPSSKVTVKVEPISSAPDTPPTSQVGRDPSLSVVLSEPAMELGSMSTEKVIFSVVSKPPSTAGSKDRTTFS